MKIRLKQIVVADFRRNELTNFKKLIPAKVRKEMKPQDAVCFISKSGDQILFVFAERTASIEKGNRIKVVQSTRLRLPKRNSWNPLMLANYAADVGLELIGLRKFEEHYKMAA